MLIINYQLLAPIVSKCQLFAKIKPEENHHNNQC